MGSLSLVGGGGGEQAPRRPALVSVAEAAHQLGVSAGFVLLLEKDGQIKFVRLRRRVLVPQSEIDRLVRDGVPVPERE